MTDSIARRITSGNVAILVVALVVVGLGTGFVLHTRRTQALDEALLAAAHGRAGPQTTAEVEVEHSRSPVETWQVDPQSGRLPRDLLRRARERERPVYADIGDERVVLLPYEVETDDEQEETYHLVAAAASRVTLAKSVGPFAVVYTLLAIVAAIVAAWGQFRVVRRAFQPVERARQEAAQVVGLGEGERLTEEGPVEIRALLEAINDLLDRLDDAYRAQNRFTAEAAHELRTPVTSMLGELDVALRSEPSAEGDREVLESMREEVQRLRRLVEALTALARIDAGQADRDRELVRAGEVAESALSAEAETLEAAGNEARLQIDQDPELEVHRDLLEIALTNLLRNAARHAPHTEVVVRVRRRDDRAVFLVDDAGPGVPAEEREALFDRFSRSGEARRRDRSGLGLGLPIARQVARRHGGDCTLEDSPLGGLRARLSVRVPRGG